MDVYGECLIRLMTTQGVLLLTFTPLEGISETVLQFQLSTDRATLGHMLMDRYAIDIPLWQPVLYERRWHVWRKTPGGSERSTEDLATARPRWWWPRR